MNGTSFIKEIGRSYIVSSLIPACLFVPIGFLLFKGFIPKSIISQLPETESLFSGSLIIAFILTVWVAFCLYSSVDWIFKFYEGYQFPASIKFLLTYWLKRFWYRKKASHYRSIQDIFQQEMTPENMELVNKNRSQAQAELHELEALVPLDEEYLLPTRLGNVLRASEIYPLERYQLEGITIWNRLFHVMPPQYIINLEEKNNHLVFLLNSSLLSYLLSGICILLGIIGWVFWSNYGFNVSNKTPRLNMYLTESFTPIGPIEFTIYGLVLSLFGYMLYRIAVNVAIDFGIFIRAGFDLYRLNLLKALNMSMPGTLEDEREIWPKLNEFFIAGHRLGYKNINIQFVYREEPIAVFSSEDDELENGSIDE